MTISHHPEPESLMSCSAGSMPEAFAAVMASHMAMCPCCQKELAVMAEIGTILFEQIAPTPVVRGAPIMAMRSREADAPASAPDVAAKGDVPMPLRSAVGHFLDNVAWKRVSPGVSQFQIPLSENGRGALRLIKVAPGQTLPEHGHNGSEMTLVLRGSFIDPSGHYKAGDVADLSEEVEHSPVADPDEGCICLVASDGKMRFKSRIARLVQPFTGF